MIQPEPCKACGRLIYTETRAGITVKVDPTPVDAQGASSALFSGRDVWAVQGDTEGRPVRLQAVSGSTLDALKGHPADRPVVVPTHRCPPEATDGRLRASQPLGGTRPPKGSPAGSGTPFWGPQEVFESTGRAASVANPVSDPVCDACQRVITDPRQVVGIQLGELWQWAQHVDRCP